jgi:hypothetical protein
MDYLWYVMAMLTIFVVATFPIIYVVKSGRVSIKVYYSTWKKCYWEIEVLEGNSAIYIKIKEPSHYLHKIEQRVKVVAPFAKLPWTKPLTEFFNVNINATLNRFYHGKGVVWDSLRCVTIDFRNWLRIVVFQFRSAMGNGLEERIRLNDARWWNLVSYFKNVLYTSF